jgi:hypothetical protein
MEESCFQMYKFTGENKYSVTLHIDDEDFLKVHKIEIFFCFDFEICIISLLVMSKY